MSHLMSLIEIPKLGKWVTVWGPPWSHPPHFDSTQGHPCRTPLHNSAHSWSPDQVAHVPPKLWSALNFSPVPLVQVISQEQGWCLQIHQQQMIGCVQGRGARTQVQGVCPLMRGNRGPGLLCRVVTGEWLQGSWQPQGLRDLPHWLKEVSGRTHSPGVWPRTFRDPSPLRGRQTV